MGIRFSGDSLNIRKGVQEALREVSEQVLFTGKGEDTVFVLAKPMLLSEELRDRMYEELTQLVSRYAELSERYFIHSDHPAYELVICDYKMGEPESLPEIIEVSGFETEAIT